MPNNQIACPPAVVLEQLLDEQLSDADRNAVETHVEECGDCQTRLESILASSSLPILAKNPATHVDSESWDSFRLAKLAAGSVRQHQQLGQYEIIEQIGKGGMGDVYLARHVELGKLVALKLLNSDRLDELAVARFKQEIRAVGRLDHPNIVVAHDAGKADGHHFLVMEFIDGMDLARLVERHGALNISDACEAARQAAVGLQHVYERGLVHRDVKPSNLIVGRDGRVRLVDLGLARSFGDVPADRLTAHGALLGTADYLAPEQWDQPHAADIRADIYSLGCTLFHLIAGHPPFSGPEQRTVLAKMRAHNFQSAPSLARLKADIPPELDAVVQRMLAKNPAERFSTPAQVSGALLPFCSGGDLSSLIAGNKSTARPESAISPTPAHVNPMADTIVNPPGPKSRMQYAIAAVVSIFLVGFTLLSFASWKQRPSTTPVAIADFHINHYQGEQAKPIGNISLTSQPINMNDGVRVFAHFDRPTYCYLIALNPDGTEQLCHPAFEGDHPKAALTTVPEAVTDLKFFPDEKNVFVLDSAGLQVFVLIASTKPLPGYGEWKEKFGKTPWKSVRFGGEHRWHFDGSEFARLPIERGKTGDRLAEPAILRSVCDSLKSREGVDAVQLIAFPVANKDEAAELAAKATEYCKADRFDEAIKILKQQIELKRKTKGERHFETTDAIRGLTTIETVAAMPQSDRDAFIGLYQLYDDILDLEKKGKYGDAIPLARRHIEARKKLFGPKHESTAVSEVKLAQLLHATAQYAEAEPLFRGALATIRGIVEEDHPVIGISCSNLAQNLSAQDKHMEAGPYYEQALASARRHFGDDHPETAVSYNSIAGHFDRLGQFKVSEKHYEKSLDILLRSDGEGSPRVLVARSNLAFNLSRQARYAEAEPLYRQVLTARRKLFGDNHPDTAMSFGNLATTLDELGRHAEAEPLARTALELLKKNFGEDNRHTAIAINNLAMNLQHQAKFDEAEPFFRKAVDIHVRAASDGISAHAANALNNLGTNLHYQEKYADARSSLESAIAVFLKVYSSDHPDVVHCRINLAALLDSQGKHAEAEKLLREAYMQFEKKYGKENALTAQALANWGINLHNQEKYTEAEPLIAEALALHRKLLGENHPRTTWNYLKLIVNWWALGKHQQIAELGPAAAASFESARPGLSTTGLDRVTRANELTPLFNYLAAVSASENQPVAAWQYLERRLGRGLLDDLTAKSTSDPTPNGEHISVREISNLPNIQQHMEPDMALVCWIDISGDPSFKDRDGSHWVGVVRKKGNPIWIKIGDDDKLAAKVRNLLATRAPDSDRSWKDSIAQLYTRRLAPLETFLRETDGLPAARHLIVLPSNVMASIPIEALTDKYTVSYAPSGTTYLFLRNMAQRSSSSAKNLLALGDPNFEPAKAGDAALAQRTTPYAALPATRFELHSVSRLYANASLLTGSEASEQYLKRMAESGELKRFRFLHFATHGIMDDKATLNSALILAQDQLPDPLARVLQGSRPIDGRLTAADILRDWKLDAELVTLSACETALGKFGGGEGYVGFSQALFVAGARSVLVSNWKVDDRATALLMARFYENLLGNGEKPMSKANALAEAKRWLKNLSVAQVEKLTADLPKGIPAGTRGFRREVSSNSGNQTPRPFEHPYYWSAFVLIGDPS